MFSDTSAAAPAGQEPKRLFDGKIVIPNFVAYPPAHDPELFNVQAELTGISTGARLLVGTTLLETPAMRLVVGTIINDSSAPMAGTDGKNNLPPVIVGIKPESGRGSNTTFNFTFSDPNGSSDVLATLMQIHSEDKPPLYECYMSFSFVTKELGLVLDGGTTWGTVRLGDRRVLENRNCAADPANSSVSASENEITLHLAMKFKPAFKGRKIVEAAVLDMAKLSAGPKPLGFWTVP